MYSNLKKAINNTDEDLNQFKIWKSERSNYKWNHWIHKKLQEKNNQLKENLSTTYSKIEELKSLTLDSTTQCKNAVKEAKQWINREIEETNLNLRTI